MKKLYVFISLITIVIPQNSFCQTNQEIERSFLGMKEFIVAIGTTVNDTIIADNVKKEVKKFVAIGTGLVTYFKIDTNLVYNVVTAGHVIKFFTENKKNIYIRASWADTIKTTDYWGIEIPLTNSDNTPNTFLYPNKEIDLGCILMFPMYFNKVFIEKANKKKC
ncbi:MAG: hypothetical protein HOO91_12215 [Bacteroidales bacterium]|nr:hypothetical protein [Bacteroidales bacterium]